MERIGTIVERKSGFLEEVTAELERTPERKMLIDFRTLDGEKLVLAAGDALHMPSHAPDGEPLNVLTKNGDSMAVGARITFL